MPLSTNWQPLARARRCTVPLRRARCPPTPPAGAAPQPRPPASHGRLLQPAGVDTSDGIDSGEAAEIRAAATAADGESGPFVDTVLTCEAGRARCSNLHLASWGYQCQTLDGSACCLQPNGRFCVPVVHMPAGAPDSWEGRDNTTRLASDEEEAQEQQQGDGEDTQEEGQQHDGRQGSGRWRPATGTVFEA